MKVLMTADSVGGVWTYAVELARGLEPYGIEILLVSAGGPLSEAQRLEMKRLSHVRLVETRFKLEWMPNSRRDVSALGRRLLQLASEFRPDVVHLNDYSHGALDWEVPTLVVGHSCVFSWYDGVKRQRPGREWNHYRRSVSAGLSGANLVVAPTQYMLAALDRHYGPLGSRRVISNGFTPAGGLPQSTREPFVFAAGRWWDEAKNVAALGRIANQLPWPVRIAGLPSPDGADVCLPKNVENLGRLDSAAMRRVYSRASIYCLPARYEPFGLTPLEAATHGCALVLGDIESLREVWHDAAVFVPPDDSDALAAAVKALAEDRESLARYAKRARAQARNYSRERMAAGYTEAYHDLLGIDVPVSSPSTVGGMR